MIVRLIFLTIVVVALIYLYKRLYKPNIPKAINDYTDTISCAHCGLTVPMTEAIYHQEKYYCCKEHVPG